MKTWRKWEGRPVAFRLTYGEYDVLIDDVKVGTMTNHVAYWSWLHESGRKGSAGTRVDALDALLESHSETINDWASSL